MREMTIPDRPAVPAASPVGRDWDLAMSALRNHGPCPAQDAFETNIGFELAQRMFAASAEWWAMEHAYRREMGWPDV